MDEIRGAIFALVSSCFDQFPVLDEKQLCLLHCRYGVMENPDKPGDCIVNEAGCPVLNPLHKRSEHERHCPFRLLEAASSAHKGDSDDEEIDGFVKVSEDASLRKRETANDDDDVVKPSLGTAPVLRSSAPLAASILPVSRDRCSATSLMRIVGKRGAAGQQRRCDAESIGAAVRGDIGEAGREHFVEHGAAARVDQQEDGAAAREHSRPHCAHLVKHRCRVCACCQSCRVSESALGALLL
jgi:hypothetical protein